jgi:hypothetical protein
MDLDERRPRKGRKGHPSEPSPIHKDAPPIHQDVPPFSRKNTRSGVCASFGFLKQAASRRFEQNALTSTQKKPRQPEADGAVEITGISDHFVAAGVGALAGAAFGQHEAASMAAAQAAMANLMVFMVVLVRLYWFQKLPEAIPCGKHPGNRIRANSLPTPRQAPNLRRSAYKCIHLSFGTGCSNLSLAFDPADR